MGNQNSKRYVYIRNDLATYRCEFSSNIDAIHKFYQFKTEEIEQFDIPEKMKKILIMLRRYFYRSISYNDIITYQFIANDDEASLDPNISIYFKNYPNGFLDEDNIYESIEI